MSDQPEQFKSNFKPAGDGEPGDIGVCQMCGNTDELRPYEKNFQ